MVNILNSILVSVLSDLLISSGEILAQPFYIPSSRAMAGELCGQLAISSR